MQGTKQVKAGVINFLNQFKSWKTPYFMVKNLFDYEKEFNVLNSNLIRTRNSRS